MTDDDVLVHMTVRLYMTWIDSRIHFPVKTNENLQPKTKETIRFFTDETFQIKANERICINDHSIGQPGPLTIEHRQLIW